MSNSILTTSHTYVFLVWLKMWPNNSSNTICIRLEKFPQSNGIQFD